MALLFLLLTSLALAEGYPKSQAEAWVLLGTDQFEQKVYYDKNSVEMLGQHSYQVWLKRENRLGKERKLQVQVDCQTGKLSGPDGKLEIPISPDSVGENLLNRICR